jgi:ABC-type sugar transport system ATPase subunit
LTALAAGSPGPLAGDVSVMVRPENVRIGANAFERIEPGTSLLEGTVGGIVNLGPLVNVHILCHDAPLTVLLSKREYTDHGFETGDRVFLAIAPEDVHVMEN